MKKLTNKELSAIHGGNCLCECLCDNAECKGTKHIEDNQGSCMFFCLENFCDTFRCK